jgi:hypothetical protein
LNRGKVSKIHAFGLRPDGSGKPNWMTVNAEAIGSTPIPVPHGTVVPQLSWSHLNRLTGPFGLLEHAKADQPFLAHGYTTDDNGRALVVLSRAGMSSDTTRPYLDYVNLDARPGRWRNRRAADGSWADEPGSHDAMGRGVWGLGEFASRGDTDGDLMRALNCGLALTSDHPRALAYFTLGAAAAAAAGIPGASQSVRFNLARIPRPTLESWRWPARRLTYDNARIPEALIRGGLAIADDQAVNDGIRLLEWLVDIESGDNGFSFTPVGGRGPADAKPRFDQQPLEAWAMADACEAASRVEDPSHWRQLSMEASLWFLGRNDVGLSLYDPHSGAGYDGLGRNHVNLNRGAESTLSALGAIWRLRQLSGHETR